jgi:hypothetical protein
MRRQSELERTCVWHSTLCALVSSLLPPIAKPVDVEVYWRLRDQGRLKLGEQCVANTCVRYSSSPPPVRQPKLRVSTDAVLSEP